MLKISGLAVRKNSEKFPKLLFGPDTATENNDCDEIPNKNK